MSTLSYILPGHTVWLRGGTYTGDITCSINGTAENPILIKPYPGERVIINGGLTISGVHTHWYDIEKCYIGGTRYTEEELSGPSIVAGVFDINSTTKLINWIIYDQVANGLGWWSPANGGELYGCVIFNNGWSAPDRGHGHSVYTQNLSTSDTKTMKHCVFAQQFGMDSSNLSLYGTGATGLQNYALTENVFIGGRQLIGGDAPIDDITLTDCHVNGSTLMLGYHDDGHVNTVITGLRMLGRFAPLYMRQYTLQNSLIVQTAAAKLIYSQEPAEGFVGYTSSGNAYHNTGGDAAPFQVETVASYDFDGWKARYSCDADSTYATSLPVANSIHVYPNEYKTGRGMIVVWNWTGADSVSVDVSTVLAAETNYSLRSAIDYFGDVATGTTGVDGTITIDMRAISHSVSIPDGWEAALIDTTFPTFGCFVIEAA